jgi:hypothetical protein
MSVGMSNAADLVKWNGMESTKWQMMVLQAARQEWLLTPALMNQPGFPPFEKGHSYAAIIVQVSTVDLESLKEFLASNAIITSPYSKR